MISNTIRATQDTYLKKSVQQASALEPDQKKWINQGQQLSVLEWGKEQQGHALVQLENETKQWYIFLDHWEIMPDQGNQKSVIKARQDTYLKKSVQQASALEPDQKKWINQGQQLSVLEWGKEQQGHALVQLENETQQWYIFLDHWEIMPDQADEKGTIQIKARQNTYLKKSIQQASALEPDQKKWINQGEDLSVLEWLKETENHYRVKLTHPPGEWYIFLDHWETFWDVTTYYYDLNVQQVTILQRNLGELGYYPNHPAGIIDGVKGNLTLNAIKFFARDHYLNTDETLEIGNTFYATLKTELDKINRSPLDDNKIQAVANEYHVSSAAIKAFLEVESNGKAFWESGKPPILFEQHFFYRLTNGAYGSPNWDRDAYKGGMAEYERLPEAMRINYEAALQSASWGLGQIMGENYQSVGTRSVTEFVKLNHQSAEQQLRLMMEFLRTNGLLNPLRNRDWETVARGYNGPAYKQNQYDKRLASAYRSFAA